MLRVQKTEGTILESQTNGRIESTKNSYFITLTFAPDELNKLCKENNCKESNAIATIAVRKFLERWRKEHRKSLKHWLITELGQENTERIHLHGVIFPENPINNDYLQKNGNTGAQILVSIATNKL